MILVLPMFSSEVIVLLEYISINHEIRTEGCSDTRVEIYTVVHMICTCHYQICLEMSDV